MASAPPPLSSTVATVFDAFTKKLDKEKILVGAPLEALKQALQAQKLDHGSLRQAMFKPDEPQQ